MKIVVFGLAITSSWGNGHATTYRALLRALRNRGHDIVFFERDQEWYTSNRDMPKPPFCTVHIYETWQEVLPRVRRELADCDVGLVGSYFPDGLEAIDEVFDSDSPVKGFYDIDTPITVAAARNRPSGENASSPWPLCGREKRTTYCRSRCLGSTFISALQAALCFVSWNRSSEREELFPCTAPLIGKAAACPLPAGNTPVI